MQRNTVARAVSVGAALALAICLGSNASAQSAAAVDASSPEQLVKSAAGTLLDSLNAHRDEYRQDPGKLEALVDQVLLPHFDSAFAARLVLGRHWDMATADQRQRFVMAFYHSLLNNYGNALLDFTSNRLQVLPYRGPSNSDYAVVNTRVRKSDGSVVAVNYQLHHASDGWKVWDVVVEGISYDKSFQQQLGEEINQQGLDAVIARLEHGETPASIRGTRGTRGS